MDVGAHVRGGGTLIPSLAAGDEIGATSIQVFVQSPRMWKPTQYARAVTDAFREAHAEHPRIGRVFCHATYLINLATGDPELYAKSVAALAHNVAVGRAMGADGVILHVGSHRGAGLEEVLPAVAEGLTRALDAGEPGDPDCPILIENAAGAGGTVGRSLEEIAAIVAACGRDERLGLCLDTQHLWASGVDTTTPAGARRLVREVEDRVGLERLRALHLNDSKTEFGSNRDRHANIGEGTIGAEGLAALVGHARVRDLPLLLEVPGDGDGPRAQDVVQAREVVRAGTAMYRRRAAE